MRIKRFWARGYRSLRDVELNDLGPFVVFYGPNGSGKSNVLSAIETLFSLAGALGRTASMMTMVIGAEDDVSARKFAQRAGRVALESEILRRRDLRTGELDRRIVLGLTAIAPETSRGVDLDLAIGRTAHEELTLEVTVDWNVQSEPLLFLSRFEFDGQPATTSVLPANEERYRWICAFLWERLPAVSFSLIHADRSPRSEIQAPPPTEVPDAVAWHLQAGRLKSALFAAQNSPDPGVRHRLRVLRTLLEGEPLHRPPFDVVQDPHTQALDVREPLMGEDVSFDLMGLGVAQLYTILAGVVLVGSRCVAIEEPEAHLHAPTSGSSLRRLLSRVVQEGIKQQLFIATHSNLFDLDEAGYWDVAMVNGATCIARMPLDEIDAAHLYEPGPAKHILIRLLKRYGDDFVFRTSVGERLTATVMIEALRRDDPVALEFLRTMHTTALETMALRAQDDPPDETAP